MSFGPMLDLGVLGGVVFSNINPQNKIGVKYKSTRFYVTKLQTRGNTKTLVHLVAWFLDIVITCSDFR
jgi:hypothetical protein